MIWGWRPIEYRFSFIPIWIQVQSFSQSKNLFVKNMWSNFSKSKTYVCWESIIYLVPMTKCGSFRLFVKSILGILEAVRFAAGFALLESPQLISHKFWVIGKIWNFHTVPSINILCWGFLSDLSTLRREWEDSFHLLVWPFLPFWHERSMRFCVITNSFL